MASKDFESWVALIKSHPESCMLGSDVVGGGENMGSELGRYEPFLDAISADPNDATRRNLVGGNFVRLMTDLEENRRAKMASEKLIAPHAPHSAGLILKPDYEYDDKAHTGAHSHSFTQEHKPMP